MTYQYGTGFKSTSRPWKYLKNNKVKEYVIIDETNAIKAGSSKLYQLAQVC